MGLLNSRFYKKILGIFFFGERVYKDIYQSPLDFGIFYKFLRGTSLAPPCGDPHIPKQNFSNLKQLWHIPKHKSLDIFFYPYSTFALALKFLVLKLVKKPQQYGYMASFFHQFQIQNHLLNRSIDLCFGIYSQPFKVERL